MWQGGAGIGGTETPPKIPSNVDSLIKKLSGEGSHTLVATGNWSSGDLSTLAIELKDERKEVNLDLSGVEGLTTIGVGAFNGCRSLKSITIPASVETISSLAFLGCSSLKSITIPSSVTNIMRDAFHGCSSLDTVTMEATNPPVLGLRVFDKTSDDLQILVPSGFVEKYKAANNWKDLTIKAKE